MRIRRPLSLTEAIVDLLSERVLTLLARFSLFLLVAKEGFREIGGQTVNLAGSRIATASTSELFLEGAQIDFLSPGRGVLLVNMPVHIGNSIDTEQAIFAKFRDACGI